MTVPLGVRSVPGPLGGPSVHPFYVRPSLHEDQSKDLEAHAPRRFKEPTPLRWLP